MPQRQFVTVLQEWASKQPNRLAFEFASFQGEPTQITYGELDHRARAIGAALSARTDPGDRVILLYPAGLEFIGAFFGCLYAGVIAVPLNPPKGRGADALQGVLRDAEPKLILNADDHSEDAKTLAGDSGVYALATGPLPDAAGVDWEPRFPRPEDLAFLQYTSGSTGNRRGVMVTHENLMRNSMAIACAFGCTRDTRGAIWLPHFHDMGLIGGLLQPVFVGGAVLLMSPQSFVQRPIRWLKAISSFRASMSGGPNFAYEYASDRVREKDLETLDLSCWDVAFTGAEPIRRETLARFARRFAPVGFRREAFLPCYGLAEATLLVTGRRVTPLPRIAQLTSDGRHGGPTVAEGATAVVGCGAIDDDNRVVIVDPDTLQPVPDGTVGEVLVQGPSVAKGYWRRSQETEETFGVRIGADSGRFLRTGDLGFLSGSELFITGRCKDLIIWNGRNLYPSDLEGTASGVRPALRARPTVAFGVDFQGQERIVVAQETSSSEAKRDALAEEIAKAIGLEYSVEVWEVLIVPLATIPLTSSGKVRRAECRRRYVAGELPHLARWKAADHTKTEVRPSVQTMSEEELLSFIVERIAATMGVGRAEISPDLPFAALGLDSIRAVRMTGELAESLGCDISPVILYEYPTPRTVAGALARRLDEQTREPLRPMVAATAAEPIAVIGLAGRFPGAGSPEAFWELLSTGQHAIRYGRGGPLVGSEPEVNARAGGYLDDLTLFDGDLFGISPRELSVMDPQQRMLLEVAWEALEDAAQPFSEVAGSRTGVFVGISSVDYAREPEMQRTRGDVHALLGNAVSIAANRIAYAFDLRGPSVSLDTACSSSLVALHQACQSLRCGDCRMALAGGVNLVLDEAVTHAFERAGMLSPDGLCHTFDAGANGYVRGEGCGLVVLKPLSLALRDGDRILALIRGSAVAQDGRSNGLTAPNVAAQELLLKEAIARSGLTPADIDYVEAHGTGTHLGDPIEVTALRRVFQERGERDPCVVGSVKTNVGHLEAAAGMAGVFKVVLMLQHEELVPHLHLQSPNPYARVDEAPLCCCTRRQPWCRRDRPRRAGVSSFGFGGTIAHLVLEEAPAVARAPAEAGPRVLAMAARSSAAMQKLAARFVERLRSAPEEFSDLAITATAAVHNLPARLVVVATDAAACADIILRKLEDRGPQVASRPSSAGPWSLIRGCGPIAATASDVEDLARGFPLAARELQNWDAAMREVLQIGLTGDALPGSSLRQARSLAVQVTMQRMLEAWGVIASTAWAAPGGHLAAACALGCLSPVRALHWLGKRELIPTESPLPQAGYRTHACRSTERGAPELRSDSDDEALRRWLALDESPACDVALAPDVDGCSDGVWLDLGFTKPASFPGSSVRVWESGVAPRISLLQAAAALFEAGAPVVLDGVHDGIPRRRVPLPKYPFERRPYWHSARRGPASESAVQHRAPFVHRVMTHAISGDVCVECDATQEYPLVVSDHRVGNRPVMPAAGMVEILLESARHALGLEEVTVHDLQIRRTLVLEQPRRIQCVLSPTDEGIAAKILSLETAVGFRPEQWICHATGHLRAGTAEISAPLDVGTPGAAIPVAELYRNLTDRGLDYGPSFRTIRSVSRTSAGLRGNVAVDARGDFVLSPELLDGCFQMAAALSQGDERDIRLPVGFERIVVHRGASKATCALQLRGTDSDDVLLDLCLTDQRERIADVVGLRLRRVGSTTHQTSERLYQLSWQPAEKVQDEPLAWSADNAWDRIPQVDDAVSTEDLNRYRSLLSSLDDLARAYAENAIRELVGGEGLGKSIPLDGIGERLRVLPQYQRLLLRVLQVAEQRHGLTRDGSTITVQPIAGLPTVDQLESVVTATSPGAPELQLTRRCGRLLAQVMRGEENPLELLFPGGDTSTLVSLYRDSAGPRVLNGLVAKVVAAAQRAKTGAPLRVLEAGAGTGGTTAHVMAAVDPTRTRYVVSDISMQLLHGTRARLGEPAFVSYRTLDIERSPAEQGWHAASFDVVIAANVLHATASVEDTLRHVRTLLAPGGLIVMIEGTKPLAWLDITFGLTDGWWRFSDESVRAEHPLLPVNSWASLLERAGFESVRALPDDRDREDPQAVIVARGAAAWTAPRPRRNWLVIDDGTKVGEGVERALRLAADSVRMARSGPQENTLELAGSVLTAAEAVRRCGKLDGMVDLRPIRHQGWDRDTVGMGESISGCAAGPVATLRAVAAEGIALPVGAWIVTRRAVQSGEPQDLAASALWGIGRTLAFEHPELSCRLVDLAGLDESLETRQLFEELVHPDEETQIRLCGSERQVARLSRVEIPRPATPARRSGAGTQVITGAFGGIGRLVARWCIARGATSLLLMGRSEPSAEALREIEEYREKADVRIIRIDVADFAAMKRALTSISTHIRGVFHCAGLLEDGAFVHLPWSRFESVLAAKAGGAWNLHRLTAGHPVEHFVLFASAAGLLGSPGQANHAAANAVMDAIAHHRRVLGLPAQSIDWGPWARVGAAATKGRASRLSTLGIGSLEPSEGMALLESVLATDRVQTAAVAIDWTRFRRACATVANTPWLAELRDRDESIAPGGDPPNADQATVPAVDITSQLARAVGQVLGLEETEIDSQRPLLELGMDSIMSLDLKSEIEKRYAVQLPLGTLLDGATIERIAAEIERQLGILRPGCGDGVAPPAADPRALLAQLSELSDEQVSALLSEYGQS